MFVCDIWVFKMDVRCFLLNVLLLQTLAWCGAKHVTINLNSPMDFEGVEGVQESIRNLMHTGIYSHKHLDASKVQVTHPVKVTHDGILLSNSVEHAHEHGHARSRRDLHYVEQDLPHSLHYNLTVDGKDLRLDLRPSVTFITPAMVVERHRVSGRTRSRPQPDATSCHYTGSIRGQPGSVVAISACDGLAGHLRTENGEYWIEPSNQLPTENTEGRPHIIFRRSAVDKIEAFHREKRAIENRSNGNQNSQRNNAYQNNNKNLRRNIENRRSRMDSDKRRREYLERRQRRLEAMRRNPVEYRRQQATLRMEERRPHQNPKSNSIEASKSLEQSIERRNQKRILDKETEHRMRRIRNRRQRKRRNCATKQPPYQWREHNLAEQRAVKNNKNKRQQTTLNRLNEQNQSEGAKRSTRSVSRPRHVEVLLVADKSMTDFHNQGNLETYLLTIMNMVSSLYMDPSIGNYIKVVVVKIILVEEIDAAKELQVSTNADSTLASFCRWQQGLNPGDDQNPHHHDVAILVTRKDICSQHNSPCSTLGVAHVAGMCKPDRSCSVNEDNGIMLAHTITHELGHNFGLYHDTEKIGCHRRDGATLHIMTPIFEADTVQVAWSRCSKRDVTNFLDAGLGECLSDRPSQEEYYVYPEVPAGVLYDAASQCHLMFGAEAVVCAKLSEICETLWCLVNDHCQTMLRPAAPGTTCGENMWCQNQTCVERSPSPSPVDGGWSEWSEWSECSRTCGAGVSTQSRECNNPAPNNNGAYCIGDRSRYQVCNTDPCPINEPTFREVQCSKHNNMPYKNITIAEWIPYFDQDRPCELQCIPKETDLAMWNGFVADGTPCKQSLGARDMCIAGVCYKVGCDWVVGSDAKEDACGICGGDGSACKTVLGSYSKDITKQSGLDEVATIPAGSRNVKIQEKVSPGNYISIGSARSRKMYLSGARNTTLTEYFVAGAQAIYERDRDWEKVRIPGPIAEDIKVYQRLYRGSRHRNPGVTYQYTVDAKGVKQFHYRLSEWSGCSVTCGVGYMRRQPECVDRHDRVVEQSQCYNIEPPRHEALMQQCRKEPCQTHTRSTNTRQQSSTHTRPPVHSQLEHTRSHAIQNINSQHENPRSQSEHPRNEPEHTRPHPEYQRTQSEHTRSQPENPRTQPEHLRTPPVNSRTQPEHTRTQPEHTRTQPEHTRTQPEYPRTQPEHTRTQPEYQRTQPENPRTQPEHLRTLPVNSRTQPEHTRTQPEHTRTQPEYQRTQPEHPRTEPEHTRSQPAHRSEYTRSQQEYIRSQSAHTRSPLKRTRSQLEYMRSQRTAHTKAPISHPRASIAHTHWYTENWKPCRKTCHMPGEEVTKQRNVYCVNKKMNQVVADSECDVSLKPPTTIKCAGVPAC